jgi:hypothetical protein
MITETTTLSSLSVGHQHQEVPSAALSVFNPIEMYFL